MNARSIESFLCDCQPDGELLKEVLRAPPTCSANFGAAGIALALYKIGLNRADHRLLLLAKSWITQAIRHLASPDAFYRRELPEWDLTAKSVGTTTLYHSESGVRLIEALIEQALGHKPARNKAIARFVQISKRREPWCELALGQGGVLLGCSLLLAALPKSDIAWRKKLKTRGDQLYGEVLAGLRAGRLCRIEPEPYMGIAHGTSGVLYALLAWHEITGDAVSPALRSALRNLAKLGRKTKSGVRWSRLKGNREYWTGWCNGSAGHVFLWTLAARVLHQPAYLKLAVATGEYTWANGGGNLGLCCGDVGEAYAFLNLYRATNDPLWLRRAKDAGKPTAKISGYSLARGRAGAVSLLSDLDQPKTSWIPMFEGPSAEPT